MCYNNNTPNQKVSQFHNRKRGNPSIKIASWKQNSVAKRADRESKVTIFASVARKQSRFTKTGGESCVYVMIVIVTVVTSEPKGKAIGVVYTRLRTERIGSGCSMIKPLYSINYFFFFLFYIGQLLFTNKNYPSLHC